MRIALLLTFPSLFIATIATAIAPATEEQLVCTPTVMFHGKVMGARSADCKLHLRGHDESCEPQNFAAITIQIDSVMPASLTLLRAGETREFFTRFCNQKAILIGKQLTDMCSFSERDVPVRGDGFAATDKDVARAFVGQSFYFTLWSNGPQVDTWTRPDRALAMWAKICPSSPYRRKNS